MEGAMKKGGKNQTNKSGNGKICSLVFFFFGVFVLFPSWQAASAAADWRMAGTVRGSLPLPKLALNRWRPKKLISRRGTFFIGALAFRHDSWDAAPLRTGGFGCARLCVCVCCWGALYSFLFRFFGIGFVHFSVAAVAF